jgi:hypothetical protein
MRRGRRGAGSSPGVLITPLQKIIDLLVRHWLPPVRIDFDDAAFQCSKPALDGSSLRCRRYGRSHEIYNWSASAADRDRLAPLDSVEQFIQTSLRGCHAHFNHDWTVTSRNNSAIQLYEMKHLGRIYFPCRRFTWPSLLPRRHGYRRSRWRMSDQCGHACPEHLARK